MLILAWSLPDAPRHFTFSGHTYDPPLHFTTLLLLVGQTDNYRSGDSLIPLYCYMILRKEIVKRYTCSGRTVTY